MSERLEHCYMTAQIKKLLKQTGEKITCALCL